MTELNNKRRVDLLTRDKPICGQEYPCFSFLNPGKILKKREMYYFEQFLKQWGFCKSMEKFIQFLNFMSFKYKVSFEEITEDFKEFVKDEHEKLKYDTLMDDYKTYLDNHETELLKQFNIENNFQTSAFGVKFGGAFSTREEAEIRAKVLVEMDNAHTVSVGESGAWMPVDFEAYKTGRTEHLNDELNELMHKKYDNDNSAKVAHEKRVLETRHRAMDENVKNAEKYGSTVSQTIDKDGNLINVSELPPDLNLDVDNIKPTSSC